MNSRYKHIKACVQYSGGLMSWGAAKLTVDKYGADHVLLLFADTGNESDGTYRFMWQGAQVLGAELVCVRCKLNGAAYTKPWDIAFARKTLPNWRAGICTAELKRIPCETWMRENLPEDCEIVVGFSIEEQERITRLLARRTGIRWSFPLAERPYTTTCKIREWLRAANVEEPDLYAQGFNHANCNGACFKAGAGHWARLYKERPKVFAFHATKEQEWREKTGIDITIVLHKNKRITLHELAAMVDAGIISPTYYRLPCACGVMFYQEELDFNPADVDDADIDGKEDA